MHMSQRGKKRIVSIVYNIIYLRARDAAIDATERFWSRFRRYRPGWSHRPFFFFICFIAADSHLEVCQWVGMRYVSTHAQTHTHTHTHEPEDVSNIYIYKKYNWFRISIFYSVSAREWYIITTVIVLWMLKKVISCRVSR